MIKLTINGREIEAEAGAPLLQVALDHGIEIPHFCYHPGIGVEGSCRLCLVEIEGTAKLQTSCTVPVKEGMTVFTETEAVRKARKGVLEFFLLNHPLDCPFCDKGGECPLQNFTIDAGQFESRFLFEKVHKAKHQVIGEHILLDKERCVLCNRCVRFARDLAGREELGIRNRGNRCEIFVPEGTALTTGFTGNYADICPVGALTTREFRFKARPWEMKTVATVCGECSLGCNVAAWKKGNDLLRLTPRIEPEVNEWWLCDRGRFSIHRVPDSERLTAPTGESFESLIRELRRLPEHSFAVVASPSATNEEFFACKELARAAGGGRVFVPASIETRDLIRTLASEGLEGRFPESLERAEAVLVAGEDLEQEHPVLMLRLRRLALTKGLQILSAGEDWERLLPDLKRKKGAAILLSDRVISSGTPSAIRSAACRTHVLLSGANLRGMIDRWDGEVRPLADLETEIQRGKIQGLLWFGPAPATEVFGEYARGMRLFAQFVLRAAEAHPAARWVLPLDLPTEKSGTMTNHFGRVQRLRAVRRVIEKGSAPLDCLRRLASELGRSLPVEEARLYEEARRDLPSYPRSLSEIPDPARTYPFYERALWR